MLAHVHSHFHSHSLAHSIIIIIIMPWPRSPRPRPHTHAYAYAHTQLSAASAGPRLAHTLAHSRVLLYSRARLLALSTTRSCALSKRVCVCVFSVSSLPFPCAMLVVDLTQSAPHQQRLSLDYGSDATRVGVLACTREHVSLCMCVRMCLYVLRFATLRCCCSAACLPAFVIVASCVT